MCTLSEASACSFGIRPAAQNTDPIWPPRLVYNLQAIQQNPNPYKQGQTALKMQTRAISSLVKEQIMIRQLVQSGSSLGYGSQAAKLS